MNRKSMLVILAFVIIVLNLANYLVDKPNTVNTVSYLENATVHQMLFDHLGRLWVVGDNEIKTYKDGVLIESHYPHQHVGGEPNLRMDTQGRIFWFGNNSVHVYEDEKWLPLAIPEFAFDTDGFFDSFISAFEADSQGRIWMGYKNKGLSMFDGSTWQLFTEENSDLISNAVHAIAFDTGGNLWVASDRGLSTFDGDSWRNVNMLRGEAINVFSFDSRENIWLGTIDGINVLDGDSLTKYSYESLNLWPEVHEFLSQWPVESLDELVIDQEDRVWARFGGSLRVFDGTEWKYYFDDDQPFVLAMAADPQGNMLISTTPHDYTHTVIALQIDSPQLVSYEVGLLDMVRSAGIVRYLNILLGGIWVLIAMKLPKEDLVWCLYGLALYLVCVLGWVAFESGFHLPLGYLSLELIRPYFFSLNPGAFGTMGVLLGGVLNVLDQRAGIERLSSNKTSNMGWWLLAGVGIGLCPLTYEIIYRTFF